MKNVLLLVMLCVGITSNAQITLTREDFPRPTAASPLPDSVLITNINSGTTVSQSQNGPANTWSELNISGTPTYQKFVPLSATSLFLQLAFLSCDYAQPLLGGASVAGSPLTDAYEFYNYASNDTRLELKGFGGNITIPGSTTPLPLPAVYSPADLLLRFPANYGDTCSSVSGFNISIPVPNIGNITVKRNQNRVSEIDGWGTIQVPSGGIYEVLRMKSIINRVDSILTPIFPIGLPSTNIEYRWIGKGNKVPVMQINMISNGANQTPTQRFYLGGWPTSNIEITTQDEVSTVFPNPGFDHIDIDIKNLKSEKLDCQIINMNGQPVANFTFTHPSGHDFHTQIPIQLLPTGLYQITCKTDKKTISVKLIKR